MRPCGHPCCGDGGIDCAWHLSYTRSYGEVAWIAAVAGISLVQQTIKDWWYPVAPLIFISCCATIALLILMHDPVPALLGVCLVLCGDLLRRVFARRTEPIEEILTTERI